MTAEEYQGNTQQCGDVTQITGQMMEDKGSARAETARDTATPPALFIREDMSDQRLPDTNRDEGSERICIVMGGE